MSCSCRTLPWRTFVRVLVQVHRLDGAVAPGRGFRPAVAWGEGLRGLHGSKVWRSEDAVAVVERDGTNSPAEPEGGVESTVSSAVEETTRKTKRNIGISETGNKRRIGGDVDGANATGGTKWTKKPVKDRFGRYGRGEVGFAKKDKAVKDAATWQAKRGFTPESNNINHQDSSQPSSSSFSSSPVSSSADDEAKPLHPRTSNNPTKDKETWKVQKEALKEKFPSGWQPRKRLSPDALAGIRALNAQFPDVYTTPALAAKFQVSSEAIRRILKSKWAPASADEEQERQDRWFRRGKAVWEQRAALGVKPPKMWREEGIARDPGYHAWSRRAKDREREWEEEEVRKYREHRERVKRGESLEEGGGGGGGGYWGGNGRRAR